tara:strand:- start:318 stop:440 length:123 start_codon:yes stop_codon:yes gene_type:complete
VREAGREAVIEGLGGMQGGKQLCRQGDREAGNRREGRGGG